MRGRLLVSAGNLRHTGGDLNHFRASIVCVCRHVVDDESVPVLCQITFNARISIAGAAGAAIATLQLLLWLYFG